MKPLLIIKAGQTLDPIRRKHGDFEQWIMDGMRLSPAGCQTLLVYQNVELPAADRYSGIVITGSPAMVTEDQAWIRACEAFVCEAVALQVPLLGICFGHQLLAQALGGTVSWNPHGRQIGSVSVQLDSEAASEALFADMGSSIAAHVTHMQSVISPPDGAQILGHTPLDPHHILKFAPLAWGIQFHPEFDEAIMRGYIRERSAQINDEGLDAAKLLDEVRETPAAESVLRRFGALLEQREELSAAR